MTIWSVLLVAGLSLAWLAPAPVLTFSGVVGAGCVVAGGGASTACAFAASTAIKDAAVAADVKRARTNKRLRMRVMKSP
jgi:hypothetical protein